MGECGLPPEKLAQTIFGPDGITPIGAPIPKGVDLDEYHRRRSAKALGRVDVDEASGVATVNCPYCAIYYRKANPIDITKFVDTDGKREVVVYCSEQHRVVFKPINQWRDERQKLGLQVK